MVWPRGKHLRGVAPPRPIGRSLGGQTVKTDAQRHGLLAVRKALGLQDEWTRFRPMRTTRWAEGERTSTRKKDGPLAAAPSDGGRQDASGQRLRSERYFFGVFAAAGVEATLYFSL
jgi:hypothetical protein